MADNLSDYMLHLGLPSWILFGGIQITTIERCCLEVANSARDATIERCLGKPKDGKGARLDLEQLLFHNLMLFRDNGPPDGQSSRVDGYRGGASSGCFSYICEGRGGSWS